MALHVRKLKGDLAFALAKAFNEFKKEVSLGLASAKVHADITSKAAGGDWRGPNSASALTVTAANGAGTLAALRTLCLDIYNVYLAHLADDLAHKVADPAPVLVKPTSSSTLVDLQTFVNAVKADYNTHRASTTYHGVADGTNTITSADATDQASADTLANELKADLNLHMAAAMTSPSLKLLDA